MQSSWLWLNVVPNQEPRRYELSLGVDPRLSCEACLRRAELGCRC